jgi:hypothetical protein
MKFIVTDQQGFLPVQLEQQADEVHIRVDGLYVGKFSGTELQVVTANLQDKGLTLNPNGQ